MILVIDNYDSFTYNLVQYLGELGEKVVVYRNDKIKPANIGDLSPGRIIISPGPGRPDDAGISKEVITMYGGRVPILGVCLGHQCIGEVYGAMVVRGSRIMHGKVSPVYHNGEGIFDGIPSPFIATRYHSLVIEPGSLKDPLQLTAWTEEKEIMGVRHRDKPIWGVQFHPESVLTEEGKNILRNFIKKP
ncbi:MAG: aminodeoxychorismate/anthranilate synthase component II [Candidatus Omnitrophota bacterium]|nr:aminodeoxychorismate/anthranilate synthase component II [Candidatus Omnitrophota bacterium]